MERKELSFGIQDAKTEIAATQQQLSQAQAISTTVKADTKKIQDSLSAAQKTQDAVNANLTQIQTDTKNLEDKLKKIKYTMIALGGITVVIGMFWSFPNLIDNFPVLADMVYSFSAQGRAQLGFNLWCHDVLEALPEEKARVQALFLSSNTNSSFLNRLGVSSGYAYGQQLELLTKLGTELNEGRSTTRTVATLLDYYQRSRESNPKFIELLDHQPR
jgi:hypothetical protein